MRIMILFLLLSVTYYSGIAQITATYTQSSITPSTVINLPNYVGSQADLEVLANPHNEEAVNKVIRDLQRTIILATDSKITEKVFFESLVPSYANLTFWNSINLQARERKLPANFRLLRNIISNIEKNI